MTLRVHRIPFSTNVERVSLLLAHKGLQAEWVDHDPTDRSELVRLSGQELVPVLEHDGSVLTDSPVILEYLEGRFPAPPLLPADPALRAEVRIFCDWFNRVWKRAPNLYVVEEEKPEPDEGRLTELGGRLTASLGLFEDLLMGRDFLFGELSLADVTAFPFLKYAVVWEDGDEHRFHEILRDHLRLDGRYPLVEAWIRRCDALPRARG
ncbi:MAG: glutathione S-transferase family protein [Gaiellaceae bacterium]|nr:glutathione S-transferase family protein [Gaiellaceae bacterium]